MSAAQLTYHIRLWSSITIKVQTSIILRLSDYCLKDQGYLKSLSNLQSCHISQSACTLYIYTHCTELTAETSKKW